MSYTPIAPNRLAVVQQVKQEFPLAFLDAHQEGFSLARREAFIRLVASRLHASDARFGLNGKSGTSVVSQDAISFIASASPAGGVEVIEVIVAAGAREAKPGWNDVTQTTCDHNTVGRFIRPSIVLPKPVLVSSTPGLDISVLTTELRLIRQQLERGIKVRT